MPGQRIDNFLVARLKGVPKSHVYRILRSGEVRVNSGRVAASHRLLVGDRVRVPPIRTAEREEGDAPAPPLELPVLLEDEHVLAVDKPAGLAVHGGSGIAHGAIERLRASRPQARFLELVHRLDRETSGVLLLAKKRAALTALHEDLRDRGMDKRYLVAVAGRVRDEKRRVKVALRKYSTGEGERRVTVDEREGQEAETVFRRLSRSDEFSLLEAQLLTGRTHQIRVHLAHLGHPVLGDEKYGDFALNKALRKRGLKRMFLHAAELSFDHPATGERVTVRSPLPAELEAFRRAALGEEAVRVSRYDLVIFDWDGTLIDSTGLIAACIQQSCRDMGLAVPPESEAKWVIGLGFLQSVEHVAPGLAHERQLELAQSYRRHFVAREHEAPLYAGIPELLAELRGRERRLAVATGKARGGLDRALATLRTRAVLRGHALRRRGMPKPHPDMLLRLLDETGVEPERAVMIGDTTHDLELAANAGVDAVAVCYGAHEEQQLRSREALHFAPTVEELRRWLALNA